MFLQATIKWYYLLVLLDYLDFKLQIRILYHSNTQMLIILTLYVLIFRVGKTKNHAMQRYYVRLSHSSLFSWAISINSPR